MIIIYNYNCNSFAELNTTSCKEKSSSSRSHSFGSSGTGNYSLVIFFDLIILIKNPVVLVSSQAITSASNSALFCLYVQSFKFPIGVGHIVKIPFDFVGSPKSNISSFLLDDAFLQFFMNIVPHI